MLPVQVKIVSCASCTLSEASALLQRFLSSDACSDSFARDYVANAAQALQDSISRRSGGPESRSKHCIHLHFPTPSESPSRSSNKRFDVLVSGNSTPSLLYNKLCSHGKENSLITSKIILSGVGDDHTVEKQSLSSAEDVRQDADVSVEVGSAMPKAEHAFGRHKKKRRCFAVEMDLSPTFKMADTSLCDKKRRKKEKNESKTEKIGTEDHGPDDQKHDERKRSKEKQEMETEKVVTEYRVLDNPSLHGKKKRKKEKQGNDAEDMEILHVPENGGSPASLPQAKRKVEVSNVDASYACMSAKVEEFSGSSKGKQKEGKALSATLVEDLSLESKREETDIKGSPLEFENLASKERKKTKKKRRKEEHGGLVRQTWID